MRFFVTTCCVAALCTGTAMAKPVTFKPIIDARLRYETVDQKPIVNDADAVTLRVRSGGELTSGPFSFLAEAEATLAIHEHYNSGVNGRTTFPLVADPENVELNRIQLQYKGLPKTVVTIGRQRINIDDQRFVGSVGWRDNEQTFDAVRVEWTGIKKLKADVTYAWSDRTIWGIDGGYIAGAPNAARLQAIGGDNVFVNLSYATKFGALTGFAYLVDQDEAGRTPTNVLLTTYRNSSQTFGARFAGAAPLSKAIKLTYALSYASQKDYAKNPVNYSADYLLGEVGLESKRVKLLAGYEKLGADGSAGFAFQTPLATLHKFQGWADKFLTTPANGIQDYYATISYTLPKIGKMGPLNAQLTYHQFDSDRLSLDYGHEWNAQISLKPNKKVTLLAKYADYSAKSFATDTRKFWLQLDYAY